MAKPATTKKALQTKKPTSRVSVGSGKSKKASTTSLFGKFNKWVLIGLFVIVFGAAGSYFLFASHADSRYACGAQCNGKPSTWTVPALGAACGGVRLVAQGSPSAAGAKSQANYLSLSNGTFNDPYITVKVYYSPACQTMWATTTTTRAIGRRECGTNLSRIIAPAWNSAGSCALAGGKSVTTPMVDDHSPTYGIAAQYSLVETDASGRVAAFVFRY